MAQGFFDLISMAYWLVVAVFIALSLWLPATRRGKAAAVVLVTVIALIPTFISLKHREERKGIAAQEQVVVARAQKRFAELCKGAGDKINRTVDDVDAVMLLKVRPDLEFKDHRDPMLPGAALAGERSGDEYIQMFLGVEHPVRFGNGGPSPEKIKAMNMRGGISFDGESPLPRYHYVDVIDPKDGLRYRYTAVNNFTEYKSASGIVSKTNRPSLRREPASGSAPRYAVDYEDIVNPEDRKLWIAGTIIRVIDQQTSEVLGEYTTYAIDRGMGMTDGTRAPWQYTASHGNMRCPNVNGGTSTYTRYFVDRVLKLKKGE